MIVLQELIDLILMTAIIGFIFKDIFTAPKPENYDPLKESPSKSSFEDIKFAIIVAAPAVILHELAHKIAALSMGIPAVFHAAYTWLFLGVVLKLMNFGFIFFVPGYVSIAGADPLQSAIIAFAGPFMNLLLFIGAWAALKYELVGKRYYKALYLTKRINIFLFFFNMIPIGMFDGAKVLQGLLAAF